MSKRVIFLFDVDGTLTKPRNKIEDQMAAVLKDTRNKIPIGVVGGSDLKKIVEQLGENLSEVQNSFDYVFSENGLVSFKGSESLPAESIHSKLGEEKLQEIINFCLIYIANVKIPVKRGTFIEYRRGMLNVSPIGRNCTQEERDAFSALDKQLGVRKAFVDALTERFVNDGLKFAIGGEISIDIFPQGWDKTFCLQYLRPHFDEIHFFGDRTSPGGNDHEIYTHEDTVGHSVNNPQDTRDQIAETLKKLGV